MTLVRTVTLPGGRTIPALGLGTWHMGESRSGRAVEVAALKAGIDVGLTVIDTAEMYASGGAEEVVAEAISGQRDEVYLVSKVLPQNASAKGTIAACEKSLKRLGTDRIDLYLLHWRGSYPLAETVEAFERLKTDGKIGDWGVSNFDVSDMTELARLKNGNRCAANQVMYHVGERGIEWQLLPDSQRAGIPVMAYCPLGQGGILDEPALIGLALQHGVETSAIALAYLLSKPGVLAVPKSAKTERVRAFVKAYDVNLTENDLAILDKAFPPPKRKSSLAIT